TWGSRAICKQIELGVRPGGEHPADAYEPRLVWPTATVRSKTVSSTDLISYPPAATLLLAPRDAPASALRPGRRRSESQPPRATSRQVLAPSPSPARAPPTAINPPMTGPPIGVEPWKAT